eukprot:jgi/Botrbrau1/12217/Bobra.0197s0010.1
MRERIIEKIHWNISVKEYFQHVFGKATQKTWHAELALGPWIEIDDWSLKLDEEGPPTHIRSRLQVSAGHGPLHRPYHQSGANDGDGRANGLLQQGDPHPPHHLVLHDAPPGHRRPGHLLGLHRCARNRR